MPDSCAPVSFAEPETQDKRQESSMFSHDVFMVHIRKLLKSSQVDRFANMHSPLHPGSHEARV